LEELVKIKGNSNKFNQLDKIPKDELTNQDKNFIEVYLELRGKNEEELVELSH